MADLRVEDATLREVQATFRTAASRLGPLVRALQGLNADVVGAASLADRLHDTQSLLGADVGITGQALTEVASHASEANTAFGHVDQSLSQQARAAR